MAIGRTMIGVFATYFTQSFIEFIQDITHYTFLQNALIVSIVIGTVAGVIGSFVILKGYSLLGDAISHSVLPGIAISYMFNISYFIGAFVAGILTAFGIGFVRQNSRVKYDSAIGIVFSAFFALGVILISNIKTATDLTEILFGNVLTINPADIYTIITITLLIIGTVLLFYKELLLTTFDPVMAEAWGYPVKWINYAFLVALTLVTVSSLKAVGVIMVVSLLITPASTAFLMTNHLSVMILISVGISVFSSFIGLFISYAYNWPSGAVIVLALTTIFILVFLFEPRRGTIVQLIRKEKNIDKTY